MTEHKTRIVVIGGGYAGVIAANRLGLRSDLDTTLVNPRPRFVERIRLHQLAAGSGDAVVEYREILGPGVTLVTGVATRIDIGARQVHIRDGAPLPYDYLIYAVGSDSGSPTVAGAGEFAYPVTTLEEAERLRVALIAVPADSPVCVVGAGPTGIETAAELAEQGRAVTLVCGGVLGPYLSRSGRRATARRLRLARDAGQHRVGCLRTQRDRGLAAHPQRLTRRRGGVTRGHDVAIVDAGQCLVGEQPSDGVGAQARTRRQSRNAEPGRPDRHHAAKPRPVGEVDRAGRHGDDGGAGPPDDTDPQTAARRDQPGLRHGRRAAAVQEATARCSPHACGTATAGS